MTEDMINTVTTLKPDDRVVVETVTNDFKGTVTDVVSHLKLYTDENYHVVVEDDDGGEYTITIDYEGAADSDRETPAVVASVNKTGLGSVVSIHIGQ